MSKRRLSMNSSRRPGSSRSASRMPISRGNSSGDGRLVRLGDGSPIGGAAYERARAALVEECACEGTISLARFRDLLGVSRRVAQLLLERFDADRLTIRIGDERRLRRLARGR